MPDDRGGGRRTPLDPALVDAAAGAQAQAASGMSGRDVWGQRQGRFGDFFNRLMSAWFGPGIPPAQSSPPGTEPRQFDFDVGYNIRYTPRGEEAISFPQLRAVADADTIIRLCIETRKDQLAKFGWDLVSTDEETDVSKDKRVDELKDFFKYPDRRNPWQAWLRQILEDMFSIDAVSVYRRNARGGKPYAAELLDGATIIPRIDETGRRPMGEDEIAYDQVVKGVVAAEFTDAQLMYCPRNPRTHHVYAYSVVEQCITWINIGLRHDLNLLQHFTEGNIPEALIGVPDDWNVDQIASWQRMWDSILEGNTAARRHARFIPGQIAKNYIPTRPPELKTDFDEWRTRIICYAFSLPPTAFIRQGQNRATAQVMQETALEEGLLPIMEWLRTAVFDRIIQEWFGYKDLKFQWADLKEPDPLKKAQTDDIYVRMGAKSLDDVASELGYDPPGLGPAIFTPTGVTLVKNIEEMGKIALEHAKNPPQPPAGPPGQTPPGSGKAPPGGGGGGEPPMEAEGAQGPGKERPAAAMGKVVSIDVKKKPSDRTVALLPGAEAERTLLGVGKATSFDEQQHPRDPSGESTGGQFTSAGAPEGEPGKKPEHKNKPADEEKPAGAGGEAQLVSGNDAGLQTVGMTSDDVRRMFDIGLGGTVTIGGDKDHLDVRVAVPGVLSARRQMYKDGGDLVIMNGQLTVEAGQRGNGIGSKFLAEEVASAVKAGAARIETIAAGGQGSKSNGHYTWARLGFDAPMKEVLADPPEGAKEPPAYVKAAKRMSDLMRTAQGRKWWGANGWDWGGTFDLSRGSISRTVLDRYLAAKHITVKGTPGGDVDEPLLEDGDGALLDRIWNELDSEPAVDKAYNTDEPREPAGSSAGGEWTSGGGGGGGVKVQPPPKGTTRTTHDPMVDRNRDGVTDAALVGVPGGDVPRKIPRLPNLTRDERAVETRFATAYERDPKGLADAYMSQAMFHPEAPNVFATDEAKILSGDYDHKQEGQALYNTAVHQTANAVAKQAFSDYLEKVVAKGPESKRTVLVTAGGCGAGKTNALGRAMPELSKRAGAIWDAAGEQNSTEMQWVLNKARPLGIKVTYAYISADPTSEAQLAHYVKRSIKNGRTVDARLYADSYAIGSKNFKAFYDKHKGDKDVTFVLLRHDRPNLPTRIRSVPAMPSRDKIYEATMRYLRQRGDLPPSVLRGATAGVRIWGT